MVAFPAHALPKDLHVTVLWSKNNADGLGIAKVKLPIPIGHLDGDLPTSSLMPMLVEAFVESELVVSGDTLRILAVFPGLLPEPLITLLTIELDDDQKPEPPDYEP